MTTPDVELSPLKRAIVEIRGLKARVAEAERREHEPIAVVGMGLRFPGGADDPASFWQLLWDGVDAIGEVPPERWPVDAFYDTDPETPGRMATRFGGFLTGIDQFDAAFFGISRREADSMDPQQRLVLEVAWEALEHAGIAPDALFGTNAGVFLGLTNSDYLRMLLAEPDQIDVYTATGSLGSVTAGRLSYVLGLHGPAVAIDTACSSSLVAVHLAAQSLRAGECDLALAGGVGLVLTPELTINFSRAGMMAPDGRCKTFDAAADGYVRSEGCGIVALKRLSDAHADGDTVLAVVRGSAMNQDGRSGGLTAPNGPAQERVVAAALANAGVDPHDVSYVEAHGTGTPLGDPIEVRALGAVLCRDRSAADPLLLGSVKTNLGHGEAAAGIAGLVKVILMLQHGAVPPHLNLTELSPHIAAEQLPIAVPTVRTPWPARDGGRIAGVSSFGLSGTNAHVIVAEAPPVPAAVEKATDPERPWHVLTLTARTETALRELAARYAAHLADHGDLVLPDIAYSANLGRATLGHRLAVVATDTEQARDRLVASAGGAVTGVLTGHAASASPPVAFVFTGHGSQHVGMGRELYDSSAVFRSALDRCDALLAGVIDRTLPEILFGDDGLLDQMAYAQPALFALQFALVEQWRAWGVHPSIVAGHSAGEYVAAVVAGVLSLDDGLRLIAIRGRLMQSLPADGEMVALFVEEQRVAEVLATGVGAGAVSIAAVNGPETTVISGRRDAVQAVVDALALDDDELRRLDISIAAHSPLVEPILDELERAVAGVVLSPPRITLVSSMTGAVVDTEITTPAYWRRHLRQPVRFADVFDTVRAAGCSTFVELGPHPTLTGLGQRCWPDASATWAPSLHRDLSEWEQILTSAAALFVAGVPVDWAAVDQPYQRRRVALPGYPWQRQSHWSAAIGMTRRPSATATWPAASAAALTQSDQGPLDLRVETYPARWAALDQLASASIRRAVLDLGLFATAGETHSAGQLAAAGVVRPAYEQLVARWLGHLAADGLLQAEASGRFAATAPLARPDLDGAMASALAAFGGPDPLLDYVAGCGERLAAVVSGEESALAVLFQDGSYDTVDFLYGTWAVARYLNGIARAAVAAAALARPGQFLQVLEIGAGTGGTSAALLPALPAERTSYTFTDVSDFFLARAAERFAAQPFVRFGLLDIERPPSEQGYPSEGYDIVIATDVLHATRDLDATLQHARSLLAPGGLLLAYETTDHARWRDITTGLIEGWPSFEDGWRTDHPFLSAERWSDALTEAGFAEVLALPRPDQATAVLGQHVVMASAPGEPVAGLAPAEFIEAGSDAAARVTAVLPVPGDVATALADALPDERIDVLVDVVRRVIAHVLRHPDPDGLRRDQPLLELGFDSLMAVELRNVLRRVLALPRKLPATLLFDHPNIAAIAEYLELVLTGDSAVAPVVAAPSAPLMAPSSVETIAGLTDDEVEAMLLKKLAEI